MNTWHEDTEQIGKSILRKVDGVTLATFSTQMAASHAWAMLRAGYSKSSQWATPGLSTAGDRAIFDALAARP